MTTDGCLDEATALALAGSHGSGGARRAEAMAHLDRCDACRELVAALARLGAVERLEQEVGDEATANLLGDRYQALTWLSTSGPFATLLAQDLAEGREVVVYLLPSGVVADPNAARRVAEAATRARGLVHPGIVPMLELLPTDDAWLWVTASTRGTPLSLWPMEERTLLSWMLRVAEPLAHAHGEGVVHGALEPTSVLVDPGGHVMLSGFGIARALDGVATSPRDDVAAVARLFEAALAGVGPNAGSALRGLFARARDDDHPDVVTDGAMLVAALRRQLGAERSFPGLSLERWDATGEVVGGRFHLDERAGHGGMGTVYRATDRSTGRAVAVKLVQVQPERLHREVTALEELSHPAVVRYIAHGRHKRASFIAMEWLEGETLAARLERGPFEPADAVALVRTVAEAMGEAHRRGLVHRDLKPHNIMLSGGPKTARVFDFGLSRRSDGFRPDDSQITQVGAVVGTVGFMSPEQARGDADLDARSDVFSLGCVLFECLTGVRAFRGEDPLAVLVMTVIAPSPRLSEHWPEAPDALVTLIDRMLDKDREARPRDGVEVARALEAVAATTDTMMLTTVAHRITREERAALTVLLARPTPSAAARVRELAERVAVDCGANLDVLLGGALLLYWSVETLAEEHLGRVARAALALARSFPGLTLTLATGDAEARVGGVVGEVVERAIALSVRDARRGIPIDDTTAALMRARFELAEEGNAWWLRGEAPVLERAKQAELVGRGVELEGIVGFVAGGVSERRPRVVVLRGPAGIGKSRLAFEAVERLRRRFSDAVFWYGSCEAARRGSAYGLVADLIRNAAGIRAGEATHRRRAKLRTLVARSGVADSETLMDVLGALFEGASSLTPEAAALLRDNLHDGWCALAAAFARRGPMVWWLEDVHWCDVGSASLVDASLRLAGAALSVVATARDDAREPFRTLWGARELEQVTLAPLSNAESRELVERRLGEAATEERVGRVVALGEGNPFYLEELAEAEAEGQSAVPGGALALVRSRLEALEPEARRILRAASVFGRTAWVGGIRAVLGGGKGVDVDGWVEALLKRGVLLAHHTSAIELEREVHFRHGLVRDAAYAMFTPRDRSLGHRLAGRWLENNGVRDAVLLAQHHELGEQRKKAGRFWSEAAEAALAGSDVDATVAHAERALALGVDGHGRGVLLRLVAEAEVFRGALANAERAAREAMQLLPPASHVWCDAAAQRAEALQLSGRHEELTALAAELARVDPPHAERASLSLTWARVARELRRAARHPEADALAALVDPREPGFANVRRQAFLARFHALEAQHAGHLGQRLAALEASVRFFSQCGDRRWAARERRNLAVASIALGALEEAERELAAALTTCRELHLGAFFEGVVRLARGLVRERQGNFASAQEELRWALDACLAAGAKGLAAEASAWLALAHLHAGDVSAAGAEGRAAAALASDVSVPAAALPRAIMARVALTCGDTAEAAQWALESAAPLSLEGPWVDNEMFVRWVFVEAMLAAGSDKRARAAAGAARQRLERVAETLPDRALRTAFLTRIEEHAGLLTRAQELGALSAKDGVEER